MKVQEEMHQWMIRRANKAVKSYQGRFGRGRRDQSDGRIPGRRAWVNEAWFKFKILGSRVK